MESRDSGIVCLSLTLTLGPTPTLTYLALPCPCLVFSCCLVECKISFVFVLSLDVACFCLVVLSCRFVLSSLSFTSFFVNYLGRQRSRRRSRHRRCIHFHSREPSITFNGFLQCVLVLFCLVLSCLVLSSLV